jgi:hypothetical protein
LHVSVEIHAAMLGGVLGGLVVVGGVLLDHGLRVRSESRKGAKAAVRRLTLILPRVITPLINIPGHPDFPTRDEQWGRDSDEVSDLLHQLRFETRSRELHQLVDEVQAEVSGLTMRFMNRGWTAPVTLEEYLSLNERVGHLLREIFGPRAQHDGKMTEAFNWAPDDAGHSESSD